MTARFIVDIPAQNADLYYACRFKVSDDCLFFEHRKQRHLVLSDLEFDRGVREAKVHKVLPLRDYALRAKKRFGKTSMANIIREICRERGIRTIVVPTSMGVGLVDQLRKGRITVKTKASPFYDERFIKKPFELREMVKAQRVTFKAMRLAENILRASTIRRNKTLAWKGKPLTSERLKAEVVTFLACEGYALPEGMIAACGKDSIEGHNDGSGVLRAHQAIIVDIFPRSLTTLYFGDATRTFCKGNATDKLKKQYTAVKRAQEMGIAMIRAGINGQTIHRAIVKQFEDEGYATGLKDGLQQGFVHGTGHGLGIAIHEEPLRINRRAYTLKAGNVATVEPGLYYKGVGGVRIEDVIVVTKRGCKLLATYPKRLELP